MLYFDTSALLPYYREEAHSAAVQTLLLARREPVLISFLTEVEFASALARWVRTGELDEPQANRVESAFREDLDAGRFRSVSLVRQQYERAWHWLLTRRTALCTLDALHLACASANEAELVTLDEAMREAAAYFGIRVRRP